MRSEALWLVPAGVAAVAGVTVVAGPVAGAVALAVVLLAVAGARWALRREPPEGLAVRSWPIDAAIGVLLAAAIAVIAVSLPS